MRISTRTNQFSTILTLMLVLILALQTAGWVPEPQSSGFTLAANQWTKVAECPPDPLGRELEPGRGSYVCFDPESGKFYRYGGYTPTEGNDLWQFDLVQRKWGNLLKVNYSWPPPADRPGAGPWWHMAYDSKRKVIWVYGGTGVASRTHPELFDDIWKYDPATGNFTKMNSVGFYHGSAPIVYDSKNDLIIRAPAYDGEWAYIQNRDKTYVYDPNTNQWEVKETPGSPKNALGSGWVFAQNAGKAVYMAIDRDTKLTVTWTYDAATNTWAQLNPTTVPAARVCVGTCYDPVNELVIIHGGVGGPDSGTYGGYLHRGGGVFLEDTWVLDVETGQWTEISGTVDKPVVPSLKKSDGSPLLPQRLTRGRFVLRQAMDYDTKNNVIVICAPTYGVWALKYDPAGSLPDVNLAALPSFPPPAPPMMVFPWASRNQKLLDLAENTWIKLDGGGVLGGGEIPLKYDEATGFLLKYGGCNNGGTTFASGYGNDLSAFDPATERYIALRYVDPCGPCRPANGCTRYYACDRDNECVWFAGGTSGNHLAASIPQHWSGGSGTWRYVSKQDRYEYVHHTGAFHGGAGVVCAFDQANHLFITTPKAYGTAVSVFNAVTNSWSDVSSTLNAKAYVYADFSESLGKLVVPDGGTMRTLDGKTGAWGTLPSTSLPGGRAAAAYDCYNKVIMVAGGGSVKFYNTNTGSWESRTPSGESVDISELLIFDRRHNVFIGGKRGSDLYAYKYKKASFNDPVRPEIQPAVRKALLSISAFPNPFSSSTAIRINCRLKIVDCGLKIYSINGKMIEVLTSKIKNLQSSILNQVTWNATHHPPGIYFLSVNTNHGTYTRKLVLLK